MLFDVAFWDERECERIPAERDPLSDFGRPDAVSHRKGFCFLSFAETVSISSWRAVTRLYDQPNGGPAHVTLLDGQLCVLSLQPAQMERGIIGLLLALPWLII